MWPKILILLTLFSTSVFSIENSQIQSALSQENSRDRARAIDALFENNPEMSSQNMDALMNHLQTEQRGKVQRAITSAISVTGNEQYIQRVIQHINSNESYDNDNHYISGLAQHQSPIVDRYLLNVLQGSETPRDGVMTLTTHPRRTAADYFSERVQAGDQELAAIMIERLRVEDEYIPVSALVDALKGNQQAIAVAQEVIASGESESQQYLVELVASDESAQGTQRLIALVSQTQDAATIEELAKSLGDRAQNNSEVQTSLANIYQRTRNFNSKDSIIEALVAADTNQMHRAMVVAHIQGTEKSGAIEEICAYLAQAGSQEDFAQLNRYAQRHGKGEQIKMVKALKDHIQQQNVLPFIEGLAANSQSDELNYEAAKIFLQTNNPKYVAYIAKALSFEINYNKSDMIKFVASHGGKDQILPLIDLLADDKKEIRLLALNTIKKLIQDNLSESQYASLISCLPAEQYDRSRDEARFATAAFIDIFLAMAVQSDRVNVGIQSYNNTNKPTMVARASIEEIDQIKSLIRQFIN